MIPLPCPASRRRLRSPGSLPAADCLERWHGAPLVSRRTPSDRATGLGTVLGAIARTAAQLCEATDALIYLVDGDSHRLAAKHGPVAQPPPIRHTHPLSRDPPLGRAGP